MKKWILAAAAALLIWNIYLTVSIRNLSEKSHSASPEATSDSHGASVVYNTTIEGYTTDLTETAASVQPMIVQITVRSEDSEASDRVSSGVIYSSSDDECWILTTAENIADGNTYFITFDSGITIQADSAVSDSSADIALLLCHPSFPTTPIEIGDSSAVKEGEYVIAVGSHPIENQSGSVSFGVVSLPGQVFRAGTEERQPWITEVFTTDAEVSRTGSGGPLINLSGQLIGMVSSSMTSANSSGFSTAITSSEILSSAKELQKEGSVTRGYLGAAAADVGNLALYQKSAWNLSLDLVDGVLVTVVEPGSPAEEAGIQTGDVIMSINETAIHSADDLKEVLYNSAPGDTVTVSLSRQSAAITTTATLQ